MQQLLIGVLAGFLLYVPSQPALSDDQKSSTPFDTQAIKAAFVAGSDYAKALSRLIELEQQALSLIEDEPLKLGSIGAAILGIYPASQTGHYAMQKYYAYVQADDSVELHTDRLDTIQQAMRISGDGNPDTPYSVMTMYDAHTYARSINNTPVGSIYQTTQHHPLVLLLITRPEKASLRQVFFDLSHTLPGLIHQGDKDNIPPDKRMLPWAVIRVLAAKMDTAAQAAIGAYLSNSEKFDNAIGWLKVASRTGNILANKLLARIYWRQAEQAESSDAQAEYRELSLENYLHAVALGSTNSMYTLAGLYLSDVYGKENRQAAIPLLKQAGDLGHPASLVLLARIYNVGEHVEANRAQAIEYFEKAAVLDSPHAIISYARFLIFETAKDASLTTEGPIHEWLLKLADADNAEAMIMLGNLHARGIGAAQSNRKARRWYRKAVKIEPDDADTVNEVVWTLTVTDIPGLKRTKYAHRLMEQLMTRNQTASVHPEYLDTWAATYAARGNFERAIELQNRAIAMAGKQNRLDVMNILEDHLDHFKAEQVITESAP